jgi:3'(2'), 5'-bisphosphate nucleotidase
MYEAEKEFAVELVRQAGILSLKLLSELQSTDCFIKEDGSPVTAADFTLQTLINHQIALHFPKDAIMGEEDSSFLRDHEHLRKRLHLQLKSLIPHSDENEIARLLDLGNFKGGPKGRFWTIDPIDGTKGFIRKDQYAIALALIEDGEVVLGVVGCPNMTFSQGRGALFSATKGEETQILYFDNGKKLETLKKNERSELLYCEPHADSKTHLHSEALKVAQLLEADPKPHRLDSQVKYAVIASETPSVYLRIPKKSDHVEKVWDHAAGTMIVESIGGKVTDLFGKSLDFSKGIYLSDNWGLVASNGMSHEKVLHAINQVLDER